MIYFIVSAVVTFGLIYVLMYVADLIDFRNQVHRQLYPEGPPWGGITVRDVCFRISMLQEAAKKGTGKQ